MSLSSLTVPLAEVAEALGRSPDYVRRHHRRLHEQSGFPRPLPGAGWRWSRKLIETWLAAGGVVAANDDKPNAQQEAGSAEGATGTLIEAQRAALADRYTGRA